MFLPILAIALVAGGCTRIRNTQGFIGDPELIAAVKPGVDNKDSVAKSLGRPSLGAAWTDDRWYYVTRQTKQLAFRDPRPATQLLLEIGFDKRGNVVKVSKRGLEVAANVRPAGSRTPTLGKKTNVIDAVFGNIGRVGAGPSQGQGNPDNTGGGPN